MKLLILLSLLLTWAAFNARQSQAGAEGHGGNTCKGEADREAVPCDFYYANQRHPLPYSPSAKFTLQQLDPQVSAELSTMVQLIYNRSLRGFDLRATVFDSETLPNVNGTFLYNTRTFLGVDSREDITEQGLKEQQIGYSYQFSKRREDFSGTDWVRIIEIDREQLSKLSARNQALILLHEYMHQYSFSRYKGSVYVNHDFIWNLISTLNQLLAIHDRQLQGDTSDLSEKEMLVSRRFQNILGIFYNNTTHNVSVHGGGLVLLDYKSDLEADKIDLPQGSFLGVSAVLENARPSIRNMKNQKMIDGFYRWPDIGSWPETGSIGEYYKFNEVSVGGMNQQAKTSLQIGANAALYEGCDLSDSGDMTHCTNWQIDFLPVDLQLSIGSRTLVEHAQLSIAQLHLGDEKLNCSIRILDAQWNALQAVKGGELVLSVSNTECSMILKHFYAKAHASFPIEFSSIDVPEIRNSLKSQGYGSLNVAPDIKIELGAEFLERLRVSGIMYAKTTITDKVEPAISSSLSSIKLGTKLSLKVTPRVTLNGQWNQEHFTYHVEGQNNFKRTSNRFELQANYSYGKLRGKPVHSAVKQR